jgi:hypothetical protein
VPRLSGTQAHPASLDAGVECGSFELPNTSAGDSEHAGTAAVVGGGTEHVEFFYLFYHDFAKNIWSATNFAKYTSAAVTHGIRDITSWPTAVGATRSGPIPLTLRVTSLRT